MSLKKPLLSLFVAMTFFSGAAWAEITPAQRDVLRADVLADPVASGFMASGNDTALAEWFNVAASPEFVVWRTSLSKASIISEASPTGTVFQWSSTGGYIARSQGERDAWREMFSASGEVNPSKANIQAAFNDIFSGTGAGAVNNRSHIASMSKRSATRAEKVLAQGLGSSASPAVLTLDGAISSNDARMIREAQ